jgi:membrane-associated phospholipid phosphatase
MDLPRATSPERGWGRQAVARVLTFWPAKFVGTTVGMTGFFIAYFWLLRNPHFPVTIMPLTAVDRWIGFQPYALPLYLSLWFYVSLAPALVRDRRELISYAVASVVLSVLGLGLFLFWPTAVPATSIDWAHYPAFLFLKSADAGGNACPSLHVAFAVFSAFWFERLLREMDAPAVLRAGNVLWCLGIAYSTIAVRQHVFVDVIAGAALGAVVTAGHFRWLRRGRVSGATADAW